MRNHRVQKRVGAILLGLVTAAFVFLGALFGSFEVVAVVTAVVERRERREHGRADHDRGRDLVVLLREPAFLGLLTELFNLQAGQSAAAPPQLTLPLR